MRPVQAVDAVAHDLGRAGGAEHERHRTGGHRLDDGDPEVLEPLGVVLGVLAEPGAVPVDRRFAEQPFDDRRRAR